jgi:hypothetical protein
VIDADLKVHEVTPADLPRVPSIKPLAGEPAVVAGLRALAELNGGVYPKGIDAASRQQMTDDRLKQMQSEPLTVPEAPKDLNKLPPAERMQKMKEFLQRAEEFGRRAEQHRKEDQKFEEYLLKARSQFGTCLSMWSVLQKGSDCHYAGEGIPLGQADRPILWYRPAGSDNYSVIDADLKVHEVAPADLPRIPSVPVEHPMPVQAPGK